MSRARNTLMLVAAVIGFVAMFPIMLLLALSTMQSYAIPTARGYATFAVIASALFLVGTIVVHEVDRRRGEPVGTLRGTMAISAVTAVVYLLFLLFGLRVL